MTTLTIVPLAPVDLDFEARMPAVWSQVWAAEWTKLRDEGCLPMEAATLAQTEADLAVSTARVVRLMKAADKRTSDDAARAPRGDK